MDLTLLTDLLAVAVPYAGIVALAMSLIVKPFLAAIPNWDTWQWKAFVINAITAVLSLGLCWWQIGNIPDAALPALTTACIAAGGYEWVKNTLAGIGIDITNIWTI